MTAIGHLLSGPQDVPLSGPNLGARPGAADPSAGHRPGCPRPVHAPVQEESSTGHADTEEREGLPLTLESEIEAQRGQVSCPQQPSLKEAELAKPIVVCRAGCYTVPLRHPTLKYKWLKNGANSKPDTLPPNSGQSTILDP